MEINIDKYTIKAEDEHNFALYETKPKGTFKGKKTEGTKESLIGYYGNLGSVLKAIANKGFLSASNKVDAQELMIAFSTLETRLDLKYSGVRPSQFEKKRQLDK